MIFSQIEGDSGYSVVTMTASERGLFANSHLIVGPTECLLVDGQFLLSEAEAAAAHVAATGRRLMGVYVTHGHPDHYFGTTVFRRRFPGVPILALPQVIEDIAVSFEAKRAFWLPTYGDDLPATLELPAPLDAAVLSIDGTALEVFAVGPAESPHDTVCYLPALRVLLAGDLVYNGEHGWLGEQRADEWIDALLWLTVRFGNATHVLPGHGACGGKDLFASTIEYLQVFRDAVKKGGGLEAARGRVLARYPDHGLALFLDLSLQRWLAAGI
jgi:glyoxylase-like metal-dependent hydrolase (beta-lactamase superfamily II)